MKKIKGILLFGILSLLGIGSSFAINSQFFFVDYQTLDNKNVSFGLTSVSSRKGGKYFYSLTSGTPISPNPGSDSSSSNYTPKPYLYYDNGNILTFTQGGTFNLTTGTATFDLGIHNPATYVHIIGDDSCVNTGILSAGTCSPSQVLVIDADRSYSDLGIVYDSQLDGVNYIKGVSAFTFPSTYSITFSDYDWSSDFSGNFFMFKTLYRQGDSYLSNRFFSTRLNNFEYVPNSSSFDVLLLAFTGTNLDDYDLLYTIYNCPSDSYYYSSCSYVRGGYVKNSSGFNTCSKPNNSSSVVCFDSIFSGTNFLNYMFKPHRFLYQSNSYFTGYKGKLLNSYNSTTNILSLKLTYAQSANTSSNGFITSHNLYELDLSDSSSVNILDGVDVPGNQSSGSMAINTGLFNLCLTSPSFYDLNTIFCNRVFGGRDLSYVQGLISSGAYLQSYVDGSGNLVYVIDIFDEPGVLTGGVVWDCYGDRCINTEFGSWGDVEPWEILHLSGGDILSSGYYLGFFESINETGYFFKCPYSYNNSRWVAGKSILNALGRDPFLPINCFIAAYENGRRVKLFDEAFNGYSRGPLMNGDTQNHRNLFTFFDILLSVALIFFLMKFYHLFK